VFKGLPDDVEGIATTNPATPYNEDVKVLRHIVKRLGLSHRLEVFDPLPRKEYLHKIADCKAIIDMDNRNVWGRNVLDALKVQAINVGTRSAYQEMFFGSYTVGSRNIEAVSFIMQFALQDRYTEKDLSCFIQENVLKGLEEKLRKI
jgi:hypothetical protein